MVVCRVCLAELRQFSRWIFQAATCQQALNRITLLETGPTRFSDPVWYVVRRVSNTYFVVPFCGAQLNPPTKWPSHPLVRLVPIDFKSKVLPWPTTSGKNCCRVWARMTPVLFCCHALTMSGGVYSAVCARPCRATEPLLRCDMCASNLWFLIRRLKSHARWRPS